METKRRKHEPEAQEIIQGNEPVNLDAANKLDTSTLQALQLIESNLVEFSTQAVELQRIIENLQKQLDARMQQLARYEGAIEGAQHMINSTLTKNGVSPATYIQQKAEANPAAPPQ